MGRSTSSVADALVQLEVNLLRDLRERILRVLGPEKVLGVEVVRLLAELASVGSLESTRRVMISFSTLKA